MVTTKFTLISFTPELSLLWSMASQKLYVEQYLQLKSEEMVVLRILNVKAFSWFIIEAGNNP